MSFNVLRLLQEEGYIQDGEDNLVHAEKAFFAARIMNWIRKQVQTQPDFDLAAALTMLMYYKTDLADLKFSENGDKITYRMKSNDREVQELVDSLIKSTRQVVSEEGAPSSDQPDDPSRQHDPQDS